MSFAHTVAPDDKEARRHVLVALSLWRARSTLAQKRGIRSARNLINGGRFAHGEHARNVVEAGRQGVGRAALQPGHTANGRLLSARHDVARRPVGNC